MRDEVLGRLFRMTRFRRGWTQQELATRARISASAISRIEGGLGYRYRVAVVQRHGDALGLRVELNVSGRGGEVVRLLDDEHAAIVEHVARMLTDAGWLVESEASFSVYGERGRIDLLAFHAATGTLLVVEVKTEITDLQALFGSLSVKERLAPKIAAERGRPVRAVAVLLAVAAVDRNRRVIAQHGTLFGAFERHGARVRAWVRRPRPIGSLLLYVGAPAASRTRWLAAKRRVRHSAAGPQRPAQPNSAAVQVISAPGVAGRE